ncbi:pseudouridine synthase [Evansella cellulosilytica]|uniref:Pseudouridine synthase n=1 Tax=Evansella cellulosilytica (strain ATCC 21833 / DSM 2522 / FERM P-1141 / JCM 9156 / N-4) TaxID=649639 RepID=E6U199_EVAC2|nr:pseudouridine synthase [Evansella cellulosilytica]ADU31545.1 pseudouridine synthase [Evansella cellulosilytica DSM 2522]
MRIDKLLSNTGFGSRKEVKGLLKKGGVTVNSELIKDGKRQIDPSEDHIEVFGEVIEYKPFIYLMMNKPKGVISATEDVTDKTVVDLLATEHALYDPFPVGRLDKDTTGFMLLTNDGKLAHQLTSPKKKVDKTYRVHIDAPLTSADEASLIAGVELDDGYITKPAKLTYGNDNTVIFLTITEGKFHQVKRMFQALGRKVINLKRETIGPLKLDPSLLLGEYRELTDEEVAGLREQNKS